jgi:uncharacterized OB-fold protein
MEPPPTVESFYEFCAQRKLMGLRCKSCRTVVLPPRSLCPQCRSKDLQWIELNGTGKLLTYSIVHVAAADFQPSAPYAIGIVQLTEGAKLPGMIKTDLRDLKVGMELKVEFESPRPGSWPSWVRYCFVKAGST